MNTDYLQQKLNERADEQLRLDINSLITDIHNAVDRIGFDPALLERVNKALPKPNRHDTHTIKCTFYGASRGMIFYLRNDNNMPEIKGIVIPKMINDQH